MALGGDDTKEEVRDLLNQSDISIIGAKVFNLKANLILTKTSIFKNKTKNNLHPRQLSTIRLQLPRPPKRQSSGWNGPGEGSRSPSPWCRSRRRRPRRRWPTGSPTGSATGSRRRGPWGTSVPGSRDWRTCRTTRLNQHLWRKRRLWWQTETLWWRMEESRLPAAEIFFFRNFPHLKVKPFGCQTKSFWFQDKLAFCLSVDDTNMLQNQLLGVKTLFGTTVWGVPYAKVRLLNSWLFKSFAWTKNLFSNLTTIPGWTYLSVRNQAQSRKRTRHPNAGYPRRFSGIIFF